MPFKVPSVMGSIGLMSIDPLNVPYLGAPGPLRSGSLGETSSSETGESSRMSARTMLLWGVGPALLWSEMSMGPMLLWGVGPALLWSEMSMGPMLLWGVGPALLWSDMSMDLSRVPLGVSTNGGVSLMLSYGV